MKLSLTAGVIAAALCQTDPGAAQTTDMSFKVGVTTRRFVPSEPFNWRGARTYALITSIWYPAAADVREEPQLIGPPGAALFEIGPAARNGAIARSPDRFPLLLLSHGTGGTAQSIGWLGTALAAHGFVAAAVNHPGNNALDGYTIEGFTLWGERAVDLSRVIDAMIAEPLFGPRLDPQRIGAAGFSIGGYTVLATAGAVPSVAHYRQFCDSPEADASCVAPPEFADLREKARALADSDPAYATALRTEGRSYRDPRISAVFAMAPALGQAFAPDSLPTIAVPVSITAGAGDRIVPVRSSAQYLAAAIPGAELTVLPGDVGHYVFVATCTEAGRAAFPPLCIDPPGVDRGTVQATAAGLAATFFARHLAAASPGASGGAR